MNKRSLIYLGLAVIAALIVIALEHPDNNRVDDFQYDYFIPGYDSANVATINVSQLMDGVQLERVDTTWRVRKILTATKKQLLEKEGKELPVYDWHVADDARVRHALGAFGGLEGGTIASSNPKKRHIYQVGISGVHVKLMDAKQNVITDTVIGKTGPDFMSSFIRKQENDQVLLVPRNLMGFFSATQSDWRDRRILPFLQNDIHEVMITEKDKTLIVKKSDDGKWQYIMDQITRNIAADKINTWLSTLMNLRVKEFDTGHKLKNNEHRVVVAYGDSRTFFTIGTANHASQKDWVSIHLEGNPEIYWVEKKNVDNLNIKTAINQLDAKEE